MSDSRPSRSSLVLLACGWLVAAVWVAATADARVLEPLTLLLAVGAAIANLLSVRYGDTMWVSASFTCSMLAVVVLGPAAAFVVAALGEIGAWAVAPFRRFALSANILAAGLPNLAAASLFGLLAPPVDDPLLFVAALAPVAALALALSFAIITTLGAPSLGEGLRASLRLPRSVLPALVWAVPVAALVAYLYLHMPELAGVGLVLMVLGVTYMLQLVVATRRKEAECVTAYHDLVGGLLRTLQERDGESARHAAAVAKFAWDIAGATGLPPDQRRAAHAAGLLHDLGRIALPDTVLRADGTLTDRDWAAIERHPEEGADMLRRIGVDADVADAVEAHHERPDGRGYPRGLRGEQIPELAKIVAVAEVYDTLTSGTPFCPAVSSFHALTELHRVSGSQLEPAYVAALARVLTDRPFEYRHASGADFAAELALERDLAEAAVS
jgi:putative nucleotidyltransferase with HDIG domain